MPNLNLLEGKDFAPEIEKPETESVTYHDFEASIEEPEEVTPVEEVPAPEPVEAKATPIEPPSHFGARKSNWPIIIGIAAALLIIFLGVYYFVGTKKGGKVATSPPTGVPDTTGSVSSAEDTSQKGRQIPERPPETREVVTPPSAPQVGEPISTPFRVVANLSDGRKTGATGVSLLADFLSAFPPGMRMSFFTYGNGAYTAEIAASSEPLFTRFEQTLQSRNIGLKPQVLSEREIFVGGQVMKLRQITGHFPPSASSATGNILAFEAIRREILTVARKYQIQVKQINISPEISAESAVFRPATLKAFGSQDHILAFIRELLASRNVGVNRLMVTVLSSAELLSSNMMATLDLDIYRY